MSKEFFLTDDRYLAALYRQRDRIITGLEFEAEDSDVTGNKYTHASWGLCSNDVGAWPDAQDQLFPEKFAQTSRVNTKYRQAHHLCPMQTSDHSTGCFYSCRIFQGRKVNKHQRDKAIKLYEATIAQVRGAGA